VDEGKNGKKRAGFPQRVDKEKRKLYTMVKTRKKRGSGRNTVDENKVFQNLSTTYQQIVDNVSRDIHGTHLSTIFSQFSSKNPLTKADFFYIIEKMFNYTSRNVCYHISR